MADADFITYDSTNEEEKQPKNAWGLGAAFQSLKAATNSNSTHGGQPISNATPPTSKSSHDGNIRPGLKATVSGGTDGGIGTFFQRQLRPQTEQEILMEEKSETGSFWNNLDQDDDESVHTAAQPRQQKNGIWNSLLGGGGEESDYESDYGDSDWEAPSPRPLASRPSMQLLASNQDDEEEEEDLLPPMPLPLTKNDEPAPVVPERAPSPPPVKQRAPSPQVQRPPSPSPKPVQRAPAPTPPTLEPEPVAELTPWRKRQEKGPPPSSSALSPVPQPTPEQLTPWRKNKGPKQLTPPQEEGEDEEERRIPMPGSQWARPTQQPAINPDESELEEESMQGSFTSDAGSDVQGHDLGDDMGGLGAFLNKGNDVAMEEQIQAFMNPHPDDQSAAGYSYAPSMMPGQQDRHFLQRMDQSFGASICGTVITPEETATAAKRPWRAQQHLKRGSQLGAMAIGISKEQQAMLGTLANYDEESEEEPDDSVMYNAPPEFEKLQKATRRGSTFQDVWKDGNATVCTEMPEPAPKKKNKDPKMKMMAVVQDAMNSKAELEDTFDASFSNTSFSKMEKEFEELAKSQPPSSSNNNRGRSLSDHMQNELKDVVKKKSIQKPERKKSKISDSMKKELDQVVRKKSGTKQPERAISPMKDELNAAVRRKSGRASNKSSSGKSTPTGKSSLPEPKRSGLDALLQKDDEKRTARREAHNKPRRRKSNDGIADSTRSFKSGEGELPRRSSNDGVDTRRSKRRSSTASGRSNESASKIKKTRSKSRAAKSVATAESDEVSDLFAADKLVGAGVLFSDGDAFGDTDLFATKSKEISDEDVFAEKPSKSRSSRSKKSSADEEDLFDKKSSRSKKSSKPSRSSSDEDLFSKRVENLFDQQTKSKDEDYDRNLKDSNGKKRSKGDKIRSSSDGRRRSNDSSSKRSFKMDSESKKSRTRSKSSDDATEESSARSGRKKKSSRSKDRDGDEKLDAGIRKTKKKSSSKSRDGMDDSMGRYSTTRKSKKKSQSFADDEGSDNDTLGNSTLETKKSIKSVKSLGRKKKKKRSDGLRTSSNHEKNSSRGRDKDKDKYARSKSLDNDDTERHENTALSRIESRSRESAMTSMFDTQVEKDLNDSFVEMTTKQSKTIMRMNSRQGLSSTGISSTGTGTTANTSASSLGLDDSARDTSSRQSAPKGKQRQQRRGSLFSGFGLNRKTKHAPLADTANNSAPDGMDHDIKPQSRRRRSTSDMLPNFQNVKAAAAAAAKSVEKPPVKDKTPRHERQGLLSNNDDMFLSGDNMDTDAGWGTLALEESDKPKEKRKKKRDASSLPPTGRVGGKPGSKDRSTSNPKTMQQKESFGEGSSKSGRKKSSGNSRIKKDIDDILQSPTTSTKSGKKKKSSSSRTSSKVSDRVSESPAVKKKEKKSLAAQADDILDWEGTKTEKKKKSRSSRQ